MKAKRFKFSARIDVQRKGVKPCMGCRRSFRSIDVTRVWFCRACQGLRRKAGYKMADENETTLEIQIVDTRPRLRAGRRVAGK